MEPLRICIVGYGLAGSTFHAPFIAAVDGLRVAGVVTGNPERAAAAARRFPGVTVHATAEEVWASAGAYDAVVIATPNVSHVPLALQAIAAGLPVVVDKPLAVSADGAQRVVDAAEAAGVALTVYQNRRWDGDFRTVARLVGSGALGAVTRFESRFERWRPQPKPGWREAGSPEQGGGLLLDLGSHLVDQALVLFGPVRSTYAELIRRRPGVAVEDDVFLALTHANGVRSQLWASAVAAQLGPRFRVLGDAAAYVGYGMDPQEDALRSGGLPGEPGWGEVPPHRYGTLGTPEHSRPEPTDAGDYAEFYRRFAAALRGRGPLPVDPRDAVETLQILDRAREQTAGW